MKSSYIYAAALGVAAAVALLATAQQPTNRNALTRAPQITGFARPPMPVDAKAAEQAEEARRTAPQQRLTPSGDPLPAIVASVYSYSDGTLAMYQLPETHDGTFTKVSDVSSYYGGALAPDGTYYACIDGRFESYWENTEGHGHRIQGYDPTTWTPVGGEQYILTYRASDLAIHPQTGLGYAFCDYGSLMYAPYEINLATGDQTRLYNGSLFNDETAWCMAFNDEGVLYGVTRSGAFGTVDMNTGKTTVIKQLGMKGDSQHGWTAAFDPDSGAFIFICNLSESGTQYSRVYRVDPATGDAVLLAEWEDKCITSMFIQESPVADNAPGAPTGLAATFPAGALTGTMTFTMPATLHDGSAATGTATWTVYDGDEQMATGSAAYGSAVETSVTVSAAGEHTFNVTASNANGTGKKARLKMWVGPDTPLAPSTVSATADETETLFTVTWEAVTAGINDGYIDPAAVTYSVVRMPAGVTVCESTAATTYTDTYEAASIENVSYEVTAHHGGFTSVPAASNTVAVGALTLPYSMVEDKPDYYVGEDWTFYDVNDDGRGWETSSSYVQYRYSGANPADDWMISPPMKAYPGCKYQVTVYAGCYGSNYPERLEVKMGYGPAPADMTVTLLEPTDITQTRYDPHIFRLEMEPTQEGKLYLGLHAISDRDQYYLYITDVLIGAPVSNEGPAAVTDLMVTADPQGALTVTGRGMAPSLTSQGNALPSISHIEILRNGTLAATVENPAPGREFTFTDTAIEAEGELTYTAIPYNGENVGASGEPAKTYVGVNYPGEVQNVAIALNDDGTVTATWEPVSIDRDGYPLNATPTYTVEVYPDNAYYTSSAKYEALTDTEHTFTPTFADERNNGFVYVKVSGVTTRGIGYAGESANIPVGTPVALPFAESFPNYTLEHPWGDGESNGPQIASISDDEMAMSYQQFNGWNRMMDASFPSSEGAQDGDNGFAGMFGWSYLSDDQGNYHDEWTELISPLIDLGTSPHPTLSFYLYNFLNQNGKCLNELEVSVVSAGQRTLLRNIVVGDLSTTQGWEHVAIDLTPYAGSVVSLIFKGTIKARDDKGYNWILMDNISIADIPDTDLRADALTAPVLAEAGTPFPVTARVTNLGRLDSPAYTATLLKNGTVVATANLEPLPFSAATVLTFEGILAVSDPIGNEYAVSVEAAGDANADNNVTAPLTVGRNQLLLPVPTNVRLADDTPGVMTWDAPDMTNVEPAPFTDDFEAYGDFAQSWLFTTDAGEWTLLDIDGLPTGGVIDASTMQLLDFPGIDTRTPQSWWVQNHAYELFNNSYLAHSGLQYLANMYVANEAFTQGEQQDDWAISPMLCGKEQMISLFARSYDGATPETIELLWSEGSVDPADFTLLRRIEDMPVEWTQYIAVLPEGARRLAIRGCSYSPTGSNQTFVDDVTFVPAEGEPQQLTLKGYNLYKDNVLLTNTPQQALTYPLDGDPEQSAYAVSAVYDRGESQAVLLTDTTALEQVATGVVSVSGGRGTVTISGLHGSYSIANAAGIRVAAGTANGQVTTPLAEGVYIVLAGDTVAKVLVR